jgi:N-methylhydantoinase A
MRIEVGTDVGGTFTDLWAAVDDGRQTVVKSPSTPDIVKGILNALGLAARSLGIPADEFAAAVWRFGHGTTAGLNALLTGELPRTAVVTTAGFGDTLEIGRLQRQLAGLTDLEIGDYLNRGRWPVVVPRPLVFEVDERIAADGSVVRDLGDAELERLIIRIRDSGVDAVGVTTLWSVANPVHERRIAQALRDALPGLLVSESHRIAPGTGEYARMSTTTVNAALAPVMTGYLARLGEALRACGIASPVLVMTGEGGVVAADVVSSEPVSVLMSGPAAGVIACQRVAREMGIGNVLSVDIGGTSFDVGVIIEGQPLLSTQFSIAGAEILRPAIDVATIGAGGGSIASVRNGSLSVGPRSAGALPGPACYGRGGVEPTVTDADLVLGVLAEEDFAGGTMTLDRDAAVRAIDEHVARPLGITVLEAAAGIRDVLDSRMSDLLRSVTIERGHDPAEFVVFAGGGQGPSHAWALCRDLGVGTFVVTPVAAGQSAFGTGTSALKRTQTRACYVRIDGARRIVAGDVDAVQQDFDAMVRDLRELLGSDAHVRSTAAVRYRGQAHHLDVTVDRAVAEAGGMDALLDAFEAQYESLYGRGAGFSAAGVEITSLRAVATAPDAPHPPLANDGALTLAGHRDVVFDDPEAVVRCPVYRADFPADNQELTGPCLVTARGQTLVVPPRARVRTDAHGNLVVQLEQESPR